ncbi:chondroitinase-B domain-containing protein [uncultured Paraglaciecola sp.]|uniref:chondroitinase-B domain-containing protein n=1 Tax=uncultured Paraglaciecola sp. TaxID=1765024 RepID=UPI0025983771|nr:chondroitinase-B domain-containing protein [uncultured Paraglaciecola sp.]
MKFIPLISILFLLSACGGGSGGVREVIDSDNDGVADSSDAFPNDPSETSDSDGDGVGDNSDAFPDDATEILDNDGDGVGNNADAFPDDATESIDSDGDGVGDNADAFPDDANESVDSDGDGVGNNSDAFPDDATEILDNDGDGVGNNADAFPDDESETIDSDGDGVGDNSDAFPSNASETEDNDGDGIGDNIDPDDNAPFGEDTSAYSKPTEYNVFATSIADLETKIALASAEDIIALANGTYTNVELTIDTNGVTVIAETSGLVFIEGNSTVELTADNITFEGFTFQNGRPANNRGAIIISGDYNRVTNCKIDSFNDSNPDADYKWVSFESDAMFGEVDHCTFTGKKTEGALMVVWRDSTNPQYHHIYRNIFSDFQYVEDEDIDNDNDGWEVIRVGTSTYSQSSSYTIVESNYFYECNGEIEIIANKSGNNTFRKNTFESSSGMLVLRLGKSSIVDSNYFKVNEAFGGGGIRVTDKGHIITNNYIEGANSTSNARGGICLSSSQTDPGLGGYWEVSDVTVSNNTIINSNQSFNYGSNGRENPPESADLSNNLVRNNINNDGNFDFIRLTENSVGEKLDIVNPIYSNNYFYGSDELGLTSKPDGISLSELDLSQSDDGQYFVTDDTLNVGATVLEKLDFNSDIGCDF